MVERMDEEFFTSHLGPGQYDIIKTGDTVLSGTRQGWDELRNFISSVDFSGQANFEELARRVDIENFTSYVILNLWALNLDWPHNNWYAARRVPDGKWIFLCWDAEWSLGGGPSYGPTVDPYAFIDSGGAYGHSLSRKLFFALIGNPGYSEYYQEEVRRHLNTALSTENALRHVHRHRDTIAADIEHEVETRGYGKEQWHSQIAKIEKFVKNCGGFFQEYTDEYFSHKTSPVIGDRVAMIEGENGRRHVIYRAADGQLHEISVSSDGSREQDSPISMLAKAPPAAGHPSAYSLGAGNRRILYQGMSGHLHELSRAAVGADAGAWRHTDLTAQLDIPVADCDPSVVVFDGVPHIVYVDRMARLREIWLDKKWRQHPLPAAGNPIGFSKKGKRHIIFRVPEKWPSREPFVFDWIERGQPDYQQYRGPRNTLVWAWDNGERFRRLEPIGKPPSQVVGNPCAIHDAKRDRHYLAFPTLTGTFRRPP